MSEEEWEETESDGSWEEGSWPLGVANDLGDTVHALTFHTDTHRQTDILCICI